MKLAHLVVAGWLVSLATGLSAQSRSLAPPNPSGDTTSLGALNDTLQIGSPIQRELLLRRLGVPASIAHGAAAKPSGTAAEFDETEGSGVSLLFVPCVTGMDTSAHLFLLRPAPGPRLRVADDAPLDCWWKPASYEMVRLSGRPAMVVLAHHTNAGHGSGFVEDDMLLLEARGGRWATLLRTPEYRSEDEASAGRTVEQASTLQPLPDGSVEETRATTLHEPDLHNAISAKAPEQVRLAAVERRRWLWNQATQAYRPGPFSAVDH